MDIKKKLFRTKTEVRRVEAIRLLEKKQSQGREITLALGALASGAALVAALFLKVSLGFTLTCLGMLAVTAASLRWQRSDIQARARMKTQARAGLVAGIFATIAYDLSRWLLVRLTGFHFAPFGTFPLFGQLILGPEASQLAVQIAGTTYHYLNGICFSIAYCFLLGGRNWWWGVVWALGLEAAMFTIYPGWLDLQKVMMEFTVVSLSGHVFYGTTLGILSQRMLGRSNLPSNRLQIHTER